MYIMQLAAPCKDYLWGGTRLRDEYGKKSDKDKLAESWELSCHKDGQSVIANGDYAGKTLSEFLAENPDALGKNCRRFEYFPVLIKLIDACDNLSVQVHPDNEYAQRVEGEYGKTEMWYIVDCNEGAELIYGFKREISREEFAERIKNNTLLEAVNTVPVHKGDVFFIEAGTLHAIGKGILIAEIQQNSNTTYRVYDYGRIGADGKPRDLHVEKALDVTNLRPAPVQKKSNPVIFDGENAGTVMTLLADCDYFTAAKLQLKNTNYTTDIDNSSFVHLLTVDGTGTLEYGNEKIPLKKGESVFIPAGMGKIRIKGDCEIISTKIGDID